MYVHVTEPLREFLVQKRSVHTVPNEVEIDEVYKHVSEHNSNNLHDQVDVSTLLKDSAVLRRDSRNVELQSDLSEMQLLRLKAQERKYQKSIENIVSIHSKSHGKSEFKDASESIAFASHFILAFISAFLLGYYLGEYIFEFSANEHKYMLGGGCSFATLILESLLFIIRDQKKELIASKKPGSMIGAPVSQTNERIPATESNISASDIRQQKDSIRNRQLKKK